MSLHSLAWAWKQFPGSASSKLVLLYLADRVNPDDSQCRCWPTIQTIAHHTQLDPKTVKTCLSQLIKSGLIADTGERIGRTRSVRVLRLVDQASPKTDQLEASPNFPPSEPKNGPPKRAQKRPTESVIRKSVMESERVRTQPYVRTREGFVGPEGLSPSASRILQAFAECCPSIRVPEKLSVAVHRRLAAVDVDEHLLGIEDLFRKVEASDFLTGRSGKWKGCSFAWIVDHMVEIEEGAYDNASNHKPRISF